MTGLVRESLSLFGDGSQQLLPASFLVMAPSLGSSWPTENWGFGIRQSRIGVPPLSLTSFGTLGRSLNLSEPQLPHLNLGLRILTLKSPWQIKMRW